MSLRDKAKQSFFWSAGIQTLSQILTFLITIVLARILAPEEFGIMGMITIFIVVSKVFLEGGFSISLMRSTKVSEIDYSTVFIINLFVSSILYGLIYFFAPSIASFFSEPVLIGIIRLYGLVLLIQALTFIQSVKLNKELRFKSQFLILLPSLVISGAVSIWMAFNGYGVWSLVWKELIYAGVSSILMWYYGNWAPKLIFDFGVFKKHINFGYKLLLTNLITKGMKNGNNLVIGKYYSAADLGYFSRAKSMADIPSGFVFNVINRFLLPILAQYEDDESSLIKNFRIILKTAYYVIIPIQTIFILEAKPIFILLLTEKWLASVDYFPLLVLYGLLLLIPNYLFNIINLKGRSDFVLRVSTVDVILIGGALVLGVFYGIKTLLLALVFSGLVKAIYTMYLVTKISMYSFLNQINDLIFASTVSLLLFIIFKVVLHYNIITFDNNILEVFVVSILFSVVYYCISVLFQHSVAVEILEKVKKILLK